MKEEKATQTATQLTCKAALSLNVTRIIMTHVVTVKVLQGGKKDVKGKSCKDFFFFLLTIPRDGMIPVLLVRRENTDSSPHFIYI